MANIKITDLTAYADPAATDVLPIVDVGADVTKKVSIQDLLENAGSGTAAAPGIAFDGDSDTGIYRPGANQLALSTNGTGRLFISDDGKIGIGTSTPSSYAIQADDLVIAPSTNTAGISLVALVANYLYFSDLDAEGRGAISYLHGDDSFRFSTAASQRLIITSNGDVNIVGAGTAGVTQAVSFNGSAPSNSLVIDSTGKLGIGTSSPGANLDIASSIPALRLTDTDAANTFSTIEGNNGALLYQSDKGNAQAGSGHYFYVDTVERLRIASSGRVGIGTSAPSGLLHLASTGEARLIVDGDTNNDAGEEAAVIELKTDGGAVRHQILCPGSNNDLEIVAGSSGTTQVGVNSGIQFYTKNAGSATAAAVRIDPLGRVGIGTTSPSSLFHLASSDPRINIEDTDAGGIFQIRNTSGAGYIGTLGAHPLIFNPNASEAARFDTSGRLLVGTGSDSGGALLQVNGDRIRVATAKTPASASDTGTTGEICWDASYIYVCTATNTWKRAALSTW